MNPVSHSKCSLPHGNPEKFTSKKSSLSYDSKTSSFVPYYVHYVVFLCYW